MKRYIYSKIYFLIKCCQKIWLWVIFCYFKIKNPSRSSTNIEHLEKTLKWIEGAYNATGQKGVSRGFSLIYEEKFKKVGWQPAYPETTGYIIPSLIEAGKILENNDLIEKAKKMARWEMEIMTSDGGIPGGNLSKNPVPAIFDTGQVIRGFFALYKETRESIYLENSQKLAKWISMRESKNEGCWIDNNATSVNASTTTYNIFAIAPIAELAKETGNIELEKLARRVAEYTLNKQTENGWFKDCDFEKRPDTLLHTIAYTIDGLWDIGKILNEDRYKKSAKKALDGVISTIKQNGQMPGRLNQKWQGNNNWSCLTGMAQIGITSLKIFKDYNEEKYLKVAKNLTNFIKKVQNSTFKNLGGGIGAVWGSWPIGEQYQSYQAINWSAKFFIDLLIEIIKLENEKKEKIKVLCMSFWTPPIVRPQSILISKMIPEWKRQNIEPVIIHYDTCGKWEIDCPVYEISEYSNPKNLRPLKYLGIIFEFLYYIRTAKAIKKIIKKHKIKIVFSFSNPQNSNVIGAFLKIFSRKIKFISHFSDPWYDNPYKKFSILGSKKIRLLEWLIIKISDGVAFTNEKTRTLVMKKYPKKFWKKTFVIPHSFDPNAYPKINKTHSKYIISYIGAFYKERTPETLFKTISNLLTLNPKLNEKIELHLIGVTNEYGGFTREKMLKMLEEYKLEKITSVVPTINYKDSLKYMKLSDCLVVIDANFEQSPFLPSKAVDYLGAGKFIVGITPQKSGTRDFLDKLGFPSFYDDEVDKLTSLFAELISGQKKYSPPKNVVEEFTIEKVTKKLIKKMINI